MCRAVFWLVIGKDPAIKTRLLRTLPPKSAIFVCQNSKIQVAKNPEFFNFFAIFSLNMRTFIATFSLNFHII